MTVRIGLSNSRIVETLLSVCWMLPVKWQHLSYRIVSVLKMQALKPLCLPLY